MVLEVFNYGPASTLQPPELLIIVGCFCRLDVRVSPLLKDVLADKILVTLTEPKAFCGADESSSHIRKKGVGGRTSVTDCVKDRLDFLVICVRTSEN